MNENLAGTGRATGGDRRPRRRGPEVVLALIAATAVVVVIASNRLTPSSSRSTELSASAVLDDPSRFLGRTVQVRDWVRDVLSARAITLGPGRLLVLNLASVAAIDDVSDANDTPEGDQVVVTGRLETFHLTEIEREVGVLDTETFAVFEGAPVVIAEAMNPAP